GVLILLLRHGGELNERVRVGAGDGLAVLVPAEKPARANELDDAQERGQGVLAGALDAHEARLTEHWVAGLGIEGVPPQDEPLLLWGQPEPAVAVGAVDVLVPPFDDLPADGLIPLVLGVDPAILPGVSRLPVGVLLPHFAVGVDVLQRLRPGRHERVGRHPEGAGDKVRGQLSGGHLPRLRRTGRATAFFAAIFASPPSFAWFASGSGSIRIFISRRAFSEPPNESSVFVMSASTAPGRGALPILTSPSAEMPRNFGLNSRSQAEHLRYSCAQPTGVMNWRITSVCMAMKIALTSSDHFSFGSIHG